MCTSQDFVNWVCSEHLKSQFLRYVLLSEHDSMMRFASGTTHQTIYYPEAKAFHVCLPQLNEQTRIADLLGSLDRRIEELENQSNILNDIARTIFKSWFVDFDPVRTKAEGREPEGMDAATAALFPSGFDESERCQLPSGWKLVAIGDLAKLDKGLSYKGEHLAETGMPMINLGCFTGEGGFEAKRIRYYTGEFKEKHLVRSGDLVIANTDITQKRVVIGSPAIVPPSKDGAFLFTHHTFALRLNAKLPGLELFLYFALLQPSFRERAIGFATGTTVLAIPRDAVLALEVTFPDDAVLRAFTDLTTALLGKIHNNLREAETLAQLRDTLLPRLISGKLRVPEAEKLVEAAL